MLQKISLVKSVSRTTADQLHQYLMNFAVDTHRIFWVDDRAFVEIRAERDADLIRREFSALIQEKNDKNGVGFPW